MVAAETASGAAFFSYNTINRGIDLADRAEFYVPWVMNQRNDEQLFLGTYRLYRTDNAKAPNAGDAALSVLWAQMDPARVSARAAAPCF